MKSFDEFNDSCWFNILMQLSFDEHEKKLITSTGPDQEPVVREEWRFVYLTFDWLILQ